MTPCERACHRHRHRHPCPGAQPLLLNADGDSDASTFDTGAAARVAWGGRRAARDEQPADAVRAST